MVVCRFSKHGLAAFFQIGRKGTEYIPLNTNYLFFFYSYFHILLRKERCCIKIKSAPTPFTTNLLKSLRIVNLNFIYTL